MNVRLLGVGKTMCLGLVLCLGSLSCSHQSSGETSDEKTLSITEEKTAKLQNWDVERINAYYEKKSPLSEADYDFLLDQLEIFGNKRMSMSAEEFKSYFDNFNEKEASAYMFLAMTPAEANMKGKLTPAQTQRFNSLKRHLE